MMKTTARRLLTTSLFLTIVSAGAQAVSFALVPSYAAGPGLQAQLAVPNVHGQYGARVTAAFHLTDPYDDTYDLGGYTLSDVKRGGDVHEIGANATGGVDITYVYADQPRLTTTVYGGARYNWFHGVVSSSSGYFMDDATQLGVGTGVIFDYKLARYITFTVEIGADAYQRATFTSESSSTSTRTTERYTVTPQDPDYREMDAFVQQPTRLGKLKIGLALTF